MKLFIQWTTKTYNLLLKIETGLLITLLLSIIVLAVAQIMMRNLFEGGVFWAEAYIRTAVLWVSLLGAMISSREGEHLAIDFFVHHLTAQKQRVVQRITDLLSSALCFVMTYYSSSFVYSEYQDGGISFSFVPNWLCEIIIPITFAVIACRYLVAAVFNIHKEV